MILLHYLAHEFILGAYSISSFATFQHPYVQFVMTNCGTKQGWDCTDTEGGGHQQPGSSCSPHQVEELQLRSRNEKAVSGDLGSYA